MRLVLDTNIVVSALIWGGTPAKFLQAAADGKIELVTSPVLLNELGDVLARKHLASRLAQHQTTVSQAKSLYAAATTHVTPATIPRVVTRDTDDDHVIACALLRPKSSCPATETCWSSGCTAESPS